MLYLKMFIPRKFMKENGILNAYKLIANTKKYLQSDWVRMVQY